MRFCMCAFKTICNLLKDAHNKSKHLRIKIKVPTLSSFKVYSLRLQRGLNFLSHVGAWACGCAGTSVHVRVEDRHGCRVSSSIALLFHWGGLSLHHSCQIHPVQLAQGPSGSLGLQAVCLALLTLAWMLENLNSSLHGSSPNAYSLSHLPSPWLLILKT